MANIKKREEQTAVIEAEVVRENINRALIQMPELISFDSLDPANEMLALMCSVGQGVPAHERDGWRGTVVKWWFGPYTITDQKTGELITMPSLVLIPVEGEMCRLTGWPCVNTWVNILRHLGADRCRKGVAVKASLRASGVSGRDYWTVMPDA